MWRPRHFLGCLLLLFAQACGHDRPATSTVSAPPPPIERVPARAPLTEAAAEEGVRTKGSSVHARIVALIAKGEFAEAQVLISESVKAGAISQQLATRLMDKIALLNTRLGEVPATLQRAPNFPSQLRDYTLFQIESMLARDDFSLATQAQLKLAVKLIEQQARLMAK